VYSVGTLRSHYSLYLLIFLAHNIITNTKRSEQNNSTSHSTQPNPSHVLEMRPNPTNLDFTEARDSEWHWHHLGHMQVCISLQTDNHAKTPPLKFLQAGCPSCRPTNSVKALKALQGTKMCRKL